MSVKKKQLSVDEMEKVTGGARTFEKVPNPDEMESGGGWLKVYVNGVLEATYEYENEMYLEALMCSLLNMDGYSKGYKAG